MNAHVEALGWALLHSLWQGAALWLVLEAALAWPRVVSPRVRGRLAGAALALFVVAVAGTYGWVVKTERAASLATAAAIGSAGEASPILRVGIADEAGPAARVGSGAARMEAGADAAGSSWRERFRPVLPWLVGLWGAGVVAGLVRHGREWRMLRRLARTPLVELPAEWATRFGELCQRCAQGVARPRVGETDAVRTPLVIGGVAPVILLPAGFLAGLSPTQVEAVLAHEIAHLVRRDFWLNVLQCLAEAVFFFHPAVRVFNAHIRRERERACDDCAVAWTGDALGYVKALATLAGAEPGGMALAADGHEPGDLLARMRRLLGVPAARRSAGLAELASRRALGLLLPVGVVLAYAGLFAAAPVIVAQVLPAEKRAELVREIVAADRPEQGRVNYGGPRRYPETEITVISELRTEDGSPVPERIIGAYLSVNGDTGGSGTAVWVKGRAEFTVEAGILSLMPLTEEWAPGLLVAHEPEIGATMVTAPTIVLRKGSPLRVRLTGEGDRALVGVKVGTRVRARVAPGMTSWELPARTSDAQGVITLPQAAEGFAYELSADLSGHQNTRHEVKAFRPGETLAWRLPPSRAITGRVVDAESGRALEGVAVLLRGATNAPSVRINSLEDYVAAVSDADGRFTLPGWDEKGSYVFVFERSGYARGVAGARAGEVLDVAMKRGGFRVAGRVRLAPGMEEYRLTKNPITVWGGIKTGPNSWSGVAWTSQIVRRDGGAFRFEFDQLPGGVVRIGQTGIDRAMLELRADRTDLDLVFDQHGMWFASEWPDPSKPKAAEPAPAGPTRVVEIAVATPDGGSLAGLKLQVLVTPPDVLEPDALYYQPHAMRDGKPLRLDVPVGARVDIFSDDGVAGYAVPSRWFTAEAGVGVQRVDMMAIPAGIVTVEVRDAEGLLMAPDKLLLAGQGATAGEREVRELAGLHHQRSQERDRARWTFPNVPLGRTYRVLATSGAQVASSAEFTLNGARPVGEVAVRFGAAGPLELHVARPDGAAPGKMDLTLGVRPEPRTYGPSLTIHRTDASGVARVPAFSRTAGAGYFVEIAPERDWQPLRVEFDSAAPGPWVLKLVPGLVAEGRVAKADATPVAGKQVRAYPDVAQSQWWACPPSVAAEAPTDAEGRFRFSNLPPGRVKFVVSDAKTPRGVAFPVLELPAESGREVRVVVE